MATEIEKKFIVESGPELDSALAGATSVHEMSQGYMAADSDTTVRIRLSSDGNTEAAFLTIKGQTVGIERLEFEYEVPVDDARQMLDELCGGRSVEKTRYVVEEDGDMWEVDIFAGANEGLMIVEIELESSDSSHGLPGWVGEEVSGDHRYYNAYLARHPYSEWPDDR